MNIEEVTIRERLKGSLEELERLEQTQRKIFGTLGGHYVVDVPGIRGTVDGISNLETRCWGLRRKALEFKDTMYSMSDMLSSGEIDVAEYKPDGKEDQRQIQEIARELTRTCGALAISMYSGIRSLFYQKMEDTLKDFDANMNKWMDVSSMNVSSKVAMLSSKMKQMVHTEIHKIMMDDYRSNIVTEVILNPSSGQTVDGFMDSTMQTLSEAKAQCTDGKLELEQKISDMFDQTLLALDDLNIQVKGNTLRTTASISGQDFAIECADDMFMMNSRTTVQGDEPGIDPSSLKLAADFLMFSVDSVCQVVAFVSETAQKMLDFSVLVGTQMSNSAKDLSEQMIDSSAVVSGRFMYLVSAISSSSDRARDYLPGLLDFIGDTVPDQDFPKDVVGTTTRVSQGILDLGKKSADDQLSTIGRMTSNMFENVHNTLKKLFQNTEQVVVNLVGKFLTGQNSFVDSDLDYQETEPVMRMRAVGMKGPLLFSRATYNDVEWEKSKTSMQTPWWKNQRERLKEARDGFILGWGIPAEPWEPARPEISPYATDEEKAKAEESYKEALEQYKKEHEEWEKIKKQQLEAPDYYEDPSQGGFNVGYVARKVDAALKAMDQAIETGDLEATRLAAKMYTELAGTDDPYLSYFAMNFGYSTDSEEVVTGLQLCRNVGVWSYSDDGSNLLKNFTADTTINHPFWEEVMKHEAGGKDKIDKLILKAKLSQEGKDIDEALKAILKKYGPGTRVGEYAMSFAKTRYTFGYDYPYWDGDGEDDYWKKLGVTKGDPLKIHEILESDLFDEKVRDMYRKLQSTKDPEDLRRLLATMSQYIPGNSPLLHALKDNALKTYGFDLDDYIKDHFKQYTSEDWKKQLQEASDRRKQEMAESLISNPYDVYDPAAPLSDASSAGSDVQSSSKEDDNFPLFYWRGSKLVFENSGPSMLMHDGDQQVFNPYGHPTGKWTMYSFRPCDTLTNVQEENYPMIAITPSSFQSLKSINTMLNLVPFIVIREFYFKNQAAQIGNFIQEIVNKSSDLYESVRSQITSTEKNGESKPGSTMETIKGVVKSFTEEVKKIFNKVDIKLAVIDIPYILYCGLRQKQWGNTYIFPYIVDSGTVINESSNESEWNGQGSGFFQWIKDAVKGVSNFIGGTVTSLMGSQAMPADLFPVPTWSNNSTEKISFSFSLVLINDHIVKARNNYMCVNTIIHNNRWMQKSILAFPGALYEIWLPTGQRHLMCTGSFKLYPLGLNRMAPKGFFEGYDWDTKGGDKGLRGADFEIGTVVGLPGVKNDGSKITVKMPNPHIWHQEVIPDAYKLDITFTSCLANNLNTAVFQYYVKMASFSNYNNQSSFDWDRNADGDFATLGKGGETILSVLAKRLSDPDSNINFPVANTGNAATDTGTLPPDVVNGQNGQNGQNGNGQNGNGGENGNGNGNGNGGGNGGTGGDGGSGDGGTGGGGSGTGGGGGNDNNNEDKLEKHYVPLFTQGNNPYKLVPDAMAAVNDRIILYNSGKVPLDSFFDGLKHKYSDELKQNITDYLEKNDKKTQNPANNDTHNVPLVSASSELGKKFGADSAPLYKLNDRINDYNRGEITLDQFFASISGLKVGDGFTKSDVLNYLMENDKPENAPKYERRSNLLLPVPDESLKSVIKGDQSGAAGFMVDTAIKAASKRINEGINRYNYGEITLDQFVDEYSQMESIPTEYYDKEKLKDLLRSKVGAKSGKEPEKKHNLPNMTATNFASSFGPRQINPTVDGNVLTPEQLKDKTANVSQNVLRFVNRAIHNYNEGQTIDEATAEAIKYMTSRSYLTTMKDLGFTPERVESFIKNYLTASTSKSAAYIRGQENSRKRQRMYSRNQTSSETYIEKFEEATYNKKLQKLKTSMGDVPIDADSAVSEIKYAQKTIRETIQFLSKLYNAENNNLWWKPFERDRLYYTLTPDARVVLRQRYGEKFIQLKKLEEKIQNTSDVLDRVNEELSHIPDLAERNPMLEKKVSVTRDLNNLEKQRDFLSDELIQIDTDLIRDAFDEHDAVVSVKRRDLTSGVFQQVWNEKIMNSYEREQMQYLTSDEKKRYFDDKIREIGKWDVHGILKKKDWFFRVVVMDFIVGEMKVLVQWFGECTYQDFETVYRIVRKLRLLRLDFDQAVSAEDFHINRTNLFRMTEQQVMDFKRLDQILQESTLYDLFLGQLEIQFPESTSETESGTSVGKSDMSREVAQEQESEENLFLQRTVRQDVVARNWGSETELTKEAYDKVCKQLSSKDEKITVSLDGDQVEPFDSIRDLKNEIMRLKISGDNQDRLQKLLGAFTSYVSLAKEAMVTEKMNEMRILAKKETEKEDQSVNAKVFRDSEMEDVPFPEDYS